MQIDLAPILAMLRRDIPSLAGVYLFGSYATGAQRAQSDIDLAVYAGGLIDLALLRDVREKAARLALRDVDLLDLAAADTVLQMQVIGEGRLVEALKPTAVALFEVRIMRDYQDLKTRRAGIEADVVKRGRVYA